jgi:protein subunit release factor B
MKTPLFTLTRKDFTVEFFRGSGDGGQKRNKTSNCCRITHPESGATGIGTEHREQHRNKRSAFERMVASNKFQIYIKKRSGLAVQTEEETRAWVDDQMQEKNLKIEYLTPEENAV